ncbi:MAG: RecQ family ATP-dependent DNA helicase [Armatimonadota bacterium]|nr:RecQ family ATP-dependent DNA helicase [bacterium]
MRGVVYLGDDLKLQGAIVAIAEQSSSLAAHLARLFGFDEFRMGQQQVVEHVMAGRNVLAAMPTGAGKSLCYQLPAMLLNGLTLVVSPLIALMKDQIDGLPADVQSQVTLINSTLEGDEIDRRLNEIRAGKYKLVYAAPERLRQMPFLHALKRRSVSLLVIDEAHCVSMWGHDFRPDYLFIGDAIRYMGEPTVLAMTATATPKMRVEISDHLGLHMEVVSTGTHRPNLFLETVRVRSDEDKMHELVRLCREIDGAGIVYTRSRKKAEELSRILNREQIRATHYHAGMNADERECAQEDFMDDRRRVICATVAFGMGIDKPNVRFVIHYSLPQALEDYYQEAGRAGRDGLPSRCILLYTSSDKSNVTRWMRQERLDASLPQSCYKIIRQLTLDSPYAAIHVDDFSRELEKDETQIRVAISILEEIGLVRRHPDIPMTSTIGLPSAPSVDPELAKFVKAAKIRLGQRISIETMNLSSHTKIAPHALEEKLLDWQSKGFLTYWGSGRVMLLERLPAPRDSKRRLNDFLSRYAQMQESRVENMFNYAETRHCRHDTIANHFGEPVIARCACCDNCSPQKRPSEPVSKQAKPIETDLNDEQMRQKVLETVEKIPGKVGFTGLVRVLKGSMSSYIKRDSCSNFGIFANLPKTTVERCVQSLIEDGSIRRDDGEYRLIWPT